MGLLTHFFFNSKTYAETVDLILFKNLSKTSSVIFDIGANTGLYSIISQKSNSKSTVFAFEPYITNLKRLKYNLSLNKLNNVRVINQALGDSICEIEFAVPEFEQICDTPSVDIEFTNRFYRQWINYKNIRVQQTTLDQFISDNNIETLDLIKIDVENYELAVLRGVEKSLDKFSPVILIEIFVDDERKAFFESFLKPKGYNCYCILKEGLIRVESLFENPNSRNFIMSKKKSENEYLPFSKMEEIINVFN